MLYDVTQPIRQRSTPRYTLPDGRIVRCVLAMNWEVITLDGKHVEYFKATEITYESSLTAEYLKSRSFKQ